MLGPFKNSKLSNFTNSLYYNYLYCSPECQWKLNCKSAFPPRPLPPKIPPPTLNKCVKYFDVPDTATQWYMGRQRTNLKPCKKRYCFKFIRPIRHEVPEEFDWNALEGRASPEFLALIKKKLHCVLKKRRHFTKDTTFSYLKFDENKKYRHMRQGIDTAAPIEFHCKNMCCPRRGLTAAEINKLGKNQMQCCARFNTDYVEEAKAPAGDDRLHWIYNINHELSKDISTNVERYVHVNKKENEKDETDVREPKLVCKAVPQDLPEEIRKMEEMEAREKAKNDSKYCKCEGTRESAEKKPKKEHSEKKYNIYCRCGETRDNAEKQSKKGYSQKKDNKYCRCEENLPKWRRDRPNERSRYRKGDKRVRSSQQEGQQDQPEWERARSPNAMERPMMQEEDNVHMVYMKNRPKPDTKKEAFEKKPTSEAPSVADLHVIYKQEPLPPKEEAPKDTCPCLRRPKAVWPCNQLNWRGPGKDPRQIYLESSAFYRVIHANIHRRCKLRHRHTRKDKYKCLCPKAKRSRDICSTQEEDDKKSLRPHGFHSAMTRKCHHKLYVKKSKRPDCYLETDVEERPDKLCDCSGFQTFIKRRKIKDKDYYVDLPRKTKEKPYCYLWSAVDNDARAAEKERRAELKCRKLKRDVRYKRTPYCYMWSNAEPDVRGDAKRKLAIGEEKRVANKKKKIRRCYMWSHNEMRDVELRRKMDAQRLRERKRFETELPDGNDHPQQRSSYLWSSVGHKDEREALEPKQTTKKPTPKKSDSNSSMSSTYSHYEGKHKAYYLWSGERTMPVDDNRSSYSRGFGKRNRVKVVRKTSSYSIPHCQSKCTNSNKSLHSRKSAKSTEEVKELGPCDEESEQDQSSRQMWVPTVSRRPYCTRPIQFKGLNINMKFLRNKTALLARGACNGPGFSCNLRKMHAPKLLYQLMRSNERQAPRTPNSEPCITVPGSKRSACGRTKVKCKEHYSSIPSKPVRKLIRDPNCKRCRVKKCKKETPEKLTISRVENYPCLEEERRESRAQLEWEERQRKKRKKKSTFQSNDWLFTSRTKRQNVDYGRESRDPGIIVRKNRRFPMEQPTSNELMIVDKSKYRRKPTKNDWCLVRPSNVDSDEYTDPMYKRKKRPYMLYLHETNPAYLDDDSDDQRCVTNKGPLFLDTRHKCGKQCKHGESCKPRREKSVECEEYEDQPQYRTRTECPAYSYRKPCPAYNRSQNREDQPQYRTRTAHNNRKPCPAYNRIQNLEEQPQHRTRTQYTNRKSCQAYNRIQNQQCDKYETNDRFHQKHGHPQQSKSKCYRNSNKYEARCPMRQSHQQNSDMHCFAQSLEEPLCSNKYAGHKRKKATKHKDYHASSF